MFLLLLMTLLTQTILTSSSMKTDLIQLPLFTELNYNRSKPQFSITHLSMSREPKNLLIHNLTSADSRMTATHFNFPGISTNAIPKINYRLFDNVVENNDFLIYNIQYVYVILNFNDQEEPFTFKKIVPLLMRYRNSTTQECFIVNRNIEHTNLSKTIINIIARHLQDIKQRHTTSQPNRLALTQNPQQEADEEFDQHHA
ncbi:hypothetical protein KBD08_00045 [Candidatus Babeliales bacterium]|nr:hypothetical protein [Candidatus Babeliales bacterium]